MYSLFNWSINTFGLLEQAIQGLQYAQDSNTWRLSGSCNSLESLPTVSLQLGDVSVPLAPQQYMTQVHLISHYALRLLL